MSNSRTKTIIVPGPSLPSQTWWPELHSMIIESYLDKGNLALPAFPPTWTRLNADPKKGAEGLSEELGPKGHLAVIFSNERKPIASSGVLPFRGDNWINEAFKKGDAELGNGEVKEAKFDSTEPDADMIADWETCCFCVHPSQRGRGLSHQLIDLLSEVIKPKGAKRLLSNYSIDETGDFWPKLGFEVIPGAGGMLPKGFQTDPQKEGLREDVYFKMGAKVL